ncbi:MAG TPA: transaldolase, partial [Elusimicrobiota bacterium]|nr:transaldolase [Elusimicrobiota bacterium]
MNPLVELGKFQQSVWYDNIRRKLLLSGELKKLIVEDGVRGVTSNPTIFEKALSAGDDYDADIRALAARGLPVKDIFDALSVKDIQLAADLFAPLYKSSRGTDGFVSMELAPSLAHDVKGSVREARRLWSLVRRPNLMIKIPATKEGVKATEQCLLEGINVNVTLIFSVERYGQVIDAYRAALERRARAKKDLSRVASVASFFVSRIDTAVDKLLQERLSVVQDAKQRETIQGLAGKSAVANAKVAYQLYKERFGGEWFAALSKKGARVQRPLWASTGTKNPAYSDVLYVEELIGENTVNTMPPATIDAFREHGKPRATLEENVASAQETLRRLGDVGIDFGRVTDQLEAEGEKLFSDSYDKLIRGLEEKRGRILLSLRTGASFSLGHYEADVNAALQNMQKGKVADRLWARDASLWKSEPALQSAIRNRLGWLLLSSSMREKAARLGEFVEKIRKAGFKRVVLLTVDQRTRCLVP